MNKKHAVLFALLAVGTAIVFSIYAAAERTTSPETDFLRRTSQTLFTVLTANTAATNMTEQQVSSLMDEAPATNLAAQLWQRMAMQSPLAFSAANVSVEVRVLECLRDGRTNDAIRQLEQKLDGDLMVLGGGLAGMDQTTKRQLGHLEALQRAKDYRLKFPRSTGDPRYDMSVEHAFSHLDE